VRRPHIREFGDQIAVVPHLVLRYFPICHDANERIEFMMRRFASINDLPIKEAERKFFWPLGRRPDEHPVSDLNL